MTKLQRQVIGATLVLTVLVLLAYPVLAWARVGFSFGSFALYGLFPLLGIYFVGVGLFKAAGRRVGNSSRPR